MSWVRARVDGQVPGQGQHGARLRLGSGKGHRSLIRAMVRARARARARARLGARVTAAV